MGFYEEAEAREEERERDEILAQTYHLLAAGGDEQASMLMLDVDCLRIETVGYDPDTADWPVPVLAAVLDVEAFLKPRFTDEVRARIWEKLSYVLRRHGRRAESLLVEETLPEVATDWRERALRHLTADRATNQARRERTDPDFPTYEGLTFGSREEIEVYKLLVKLQASTPEDQAIAVLPLPTVQLQRMGLRTPDLVVLGNGRALVIEVDGPYHRKPTRKADDSERDRHWRRCGITTYRIPVEHVDEPEELERLLREELRRALYPAR